MGNTKAREGQCFGLLHLKRPLDNGRRWPTKGLIPGLDFREIPEWGLTGSHQHADLGHEGRQKRPGILGKKRSKARGSLRRPEGSAIEPTLKECVLKARKGWQQTKSKQG